MPFAFIADAVTGANPLTLLAGANVVSGLLGANASKSAAQTQANAASQGQQLLQQNFQNLQPNYTPYMQTGQTGLNQLNNQLGYLSTPTQTYQPMGQAQFNANLAPNYQFQLGQGQNAVNAASNATGGLIGGNALKGLEDYTQNYASGAYQNALSNYMAQQGQQFNQGQTQQTNIYNRLAGIAGIGQNAVTGLSNLATGNATNISNLGVGAANAQAAGTVGASNALTGALTGATNANYLASLLNPNGANASSSGGYNLNAPGGIASYFQTGSEV